MPSADGPGQGTPGPCTREGRGGNENQRLRQAFLCGVESLAEYQAAKSDLEDQEAALQQKLDDWEAGEPEPDGRRWEQVLSTLEDPEADIQAKHRAAQGILARCVWDRANRVVRLTYRFSL